MSKNCKTPMMDKLVNLMRDGKWRPTAAIAALLYGATCNSRLMDSRNANTIKMISRAKKRGITFVYHQRKRGYRLAAEMEIMR